MNDIILHLTALNKAFGSAAVVQDLSFGVNEGEIFTLLGPSGCGKSTTLRIIAGLETPDSGSIIFEGRTLVSVSENIFVHPYQRNMGMVFQSYGIWPHLTVFENVAYPLRIRRVEQKKIENSVEKILRLVGLQEFSDRPAPMLSGGQQQRVAIARALVYEPKILLLDEPFSNLDAKLREHMRIELRELQRQIGVTIVFVTHDQVEALTLSDRIVVMNQGRCEQSGTPHEIYESPRTAFVQSFLGQTLKLDVTVKGVGDDDMVAAVLNGTDRLVFATGCGKGELVESRSASLVCRPEYLKVTPLESGNGRLPCSPDNNDLTGRIATLLFMGDRFEARIVIEGGQSVLLHLPKDSNWREGLDVAIHLPKRKGRLWLN